MKTFAQEILVVVSLFASVYSIPQNFGTRRQLLRQPVNLPIPEEQPLQRPKVYEVSHSISPNLGDGSYGYRSEFSDGLQSEQVGHYQNQQIQQGSYTTTDENGQVVRVDYIADKDGFRPVGHNGASAAPTPVPVPEEHLRARESILQQQQAIRNQHLQYLRDGYAAHGR